MSRPKIKITLIDRKGKHGCHRGHKIGDSFDFDTERGQLCPMAMHVAFHTSTFCVTAAIFLGRRTARRCFAALMWTRSTYSVLKL